MTKKNRGSSLSRYHVTFRQASRSRDQSFSCPWDMSCYMLCYSKKQRQEALMRWADEPLFIHKWATYLLATLLVRANGRRSALCSNLELFHLKWGCQCPDSSHGPRRSEARWETLKGILSVQHYFKDTSWKDWKLSGNISSQPNTDGQVKGMKKKKEDEEENCSCCYKVKASALLFTYYETNIVTQRRLLKRNC